MADITLEQANSIIAGVFAEGKKLALKPLGAAVVDAGGHIIAFQRQNGAPFGRLQLAQGKAAGALSLGMSSRKIGAAAVERPWLIASLSASIPYPMIAAAGGVIIVDGDGAPIGAVGVTGDTSDNDEICAIAGIIGAGLKVQP